jgi:hypothetical protein
MAKITIDTSPRSTPPTTPPLDIPLSEQIRLAESTGLFPPGTLRHPATVRKRKNRSTTGEPLITRIDPGFQGATIEEIRLGAESQSDEDDYDQHPGGSDDDQFDEPREVVDPASNFSRSKIPTGIKRQSSDPTGLDFADEVFIMIMYLIPMSSLYLLFDL